MLQRAALAITVLFACSCGGSSVDPPEGGFAPLPSDVELGPMPDSPPARRLAWVVRELNGDAFSIEEIESSFTPELLAGFSARDLQKALQVLSAKLAPMTVEGVIGAAEEHRITAGVLSREADWYSIKVTTAAEPPYPIAGIFYEAAPELAPPAPPNWDRYREVVAGIAPRVTFLVAELPDCRAIAELGATTMMPVGSAFKLYVLATLAEEIRAGRRSWSEMHPIRDELKSLPTGHFHLEAAGTMFTLAQYAEAMIAASDNTATDHLIDLVGRATVEAMFETAGHAEPARNRPLLKTREYFLLKLYASADAQLAYANGTEESRRAYLENELAGLDVFDLEMQAQAWIGPLALDTIEWFASNADLCRVMSRLHGSGDPELRAILSKNTVITIDPAEWSYAGFKGGSEPGLLNVTWVLDRTDGRNFVVSLTAADTNARVAQGAVVLRGRQAMTLLLGE